MLKYYNKTVDLLPFFFKDVIVNLYSFRACYLVYTSSKPLYNFHLSFYGNHYILEKNFFCLNISFA